MANKTYFGAEARKKLLAGIEPIYKAVSVTLGANGRNGVFNKFTRVPIITNDGVSIAREIEPEDLTELQGANLIKQVSESTNDDAGDGTTTSIVLAHAMISSGIEVLDKPGSKVNPMQLRREMKEAADKVIAEIEASATPISTLEELERVATISVENPDIGKTIAQAIYDASDTGVVYVNDSQKIGVSVEKGEGYQFQQGLITPYLVTNPEKMEASLENAAVLITDIQVQFNDNFKKIIFEITQKTKDILLICDEIHPDVVKFAVLNLFPREHPQTPNFRLAIVKKPIQADYLEDIATFVGATAMTSQKGNLSYDMKYIGYANKIVINEKTTTIFDGQGKQTVDEIGRDAVDVHVQNLKKQIEDSEDEIKNTKLQERIARLTGGIYFLHVGEKTEAEAKYLRLKVDDAVNATKAAKKEGIVAGGGSCLSYVGYSLFGTKENRTDGENIIYFACQAPINKILENSGMNVIYSDFKHKNAGFNALTLASEPDMITAGIIDPVKVTKTAFANAASFAGLFLTIESVTTPLPSKEHSLLPN